MVDRMRRVRLNLPMKGISSQLLSFLSHRTPVIAYKILRCLMCFLSISFLFQSTSVFAQWFVDERAIMGTLVRVELWQTDAKKAKTAINSVMAEMERIDQLMSPLIPSSELARINRKAADGPVIISRELFELIAKAQQISLLSDGAFDISFASIGKYYDYRQGKKPERATINHLLKSVNFQQIMLNKENSSIRFLDPAMAIDLGGIAKGHAVDQSIALLISMGVKSALVSAGGDTRLLGDKRGRPWIVGIKDPRNENKQAVVIPLADAAISTSGDYERFFIEGDKRVHHIIHPGSGRSAKGVQSVSIIAPDSTTADALSTTVFVLGVEKGLALINSLVGIDAIIIDAKRKMHYSQNLNSPSGKKE